MKNIFVTTPGVPRPTLASRFTAIKGERPKALTEVPAGEAVSEVYPWISSLKQVISGVAQTETRIVRAGYGSSAFINNTDRFINIKQLRIFCIAPVGATLTMGNLMIGNRLGIKVRHTDFEVVSEWIPCGMLATHNNLIAASPRPNFCMSLPTPYYLQSGHPFRVRIRATNPYHVPDVDYTFFMTLFGKDPKNGKPYELCKQVTIPYRAAPAVSDANPLYVDVVFDENRDYPMRDMLLTNIIFAATPYTSNVPAVVLQYIQQLDFQIMPPEGPKWMDFADWAPVGNLVDQAVAAFLIIHKPETPIPFLPSQQIDIDVKALLNLSYSPNGETFTFEAPLWFTLIGTQEQRVTR